MATIDSLNIAGVVLAGGSSRRMQGRDKLSLPFLGSDLLNHCVSYLETQSELVVVNSNLACASINKTIVTDKYKGEAGPLDGLASTMAWLDTQASKVEWLLSIPADCPFLPHDLAQKLEAGIRAEPSAQVALATHGGRKHYTCALWSTSLYASMRDFLDNGERALRKFIANKRYTEVEFHSDKTDPFFNINTPEDYKCALDLPQGK